MPFTAFPILPLTGGQKEDQPSELIVEQFSPDSRDVIYKDGDIETRSGLTKEFTNDLLSPLVHQFLYKQFSGTQFLILFTRLDIYYFDNTNNVPVFITPKYSTGTVDVTNGSKTITGNATLWDTAVNGRKNMRAGDYIRLGGLNDASPVWYEIDSVTNDTSAELKIAYAEATQAAQAYTNRQTFATTAAEQWSTVNFTDSSLGDVVAATNFVDFPVYWDGTNQFQIVPNANKSRVVKTLAGRLINIHTVVSGSNQTQRYEWTPVGDLTTWNASDFADITETQGGIQGAHLFRDGNFIVIFKDDSKFQLRWVGGDFTFEHDLIDNIGSEAIHSIEEVQGIGLFYYGSDLRFRMYTGATDFEVGRSIFATIESITPDNFSKIYALYIPHKKQLRVHIPIGDTSVNNLTAVMYTDNLSWWIWDYKKASAISSMSTFENIQDLFVDDSPWNDRFVDEHDGFWDDREFLEDAPIIFYGGDDNFFRRADSGLDDDGTAYTPFFETKDMDFDLPMNRKRLWKYQLWGAPEVGKSLSISVNRDQSTSFETAKTVSIDDTTKSRVKLNTPVFDAHGHTIATRISATPPWRILGLFALIKKLEKTV